MTNSENIQLAADHKRSEAKRKLAQMFRIPDGYSSTGIDELVDDIIAAAILEISAIQSKASESNAIGEARADNAASTHDQTL